MSGVAELVPTQSGHPMREVGPTPLGILRRTVTHWPHSKTRNPKRTVARSLWICRGCRGLWMAVETRSTRISTWAWRSVFPQPPTGPWKTLEAFSSAPWKTGLGRKTAEPGFPQIHNLDDDESNERDSCL